MSEDKNPIQVADRLFLILETLADTGSANLIDLSKNLHLHKSTVHRLLNSLVFMGYVKQNPKSGQYGLTFKLAEIANKMLGQMDVLTIVRPYLKKLSVQTGETVHLVQLDGADAIYIDKVESNRNSVQMVSKIGNRIPVYCSGVGKAMAAAMDKKTLDTLWYSSNIRKLTKHTIVDYEQFLKVLDEVKRKGYALDDGEYEEGVRCIAAGLQDYDGSVKYAFSISAPVQRMSRQRILELSKNVLKIKEQILQEFM